MSGAASQISIAVAEPVVAGSVETLQTAVTLAGQLITGDVVSWMTIETLHVDELPHSSVAVHVRVSV